MALFNLQAMFTADEISAMGVFENMFTLEDTEKSDLSSLGKEIPRPENPWNAEKLNAEAREQEKKTRAQAWSNATFRDGGKESFSGTNWTESTTYSHSKSTESTFPKFTYLEGYNGEQYSTSYADDCDHQNYACANHNFHQGYSSRSTSFSSQNSDGSFLETPYDFTQFLDDDDIELLNSFHFEDLFTKEYDEEPANLNFPNGHFTSSFTPPTAHEKAKLNYPKRKVHRCATRADIARWKLPPGTLLSNWDPTEEPILLLGTAFDGFSLGNWIYDWAFACDGVESPIVELAGDLWRLLIKLIGKVKHAEAVVKTIRNKDDREMVRDFIKSAHRQLKKLRRILRRTEGPMLDTMDKQTTKAGEHPKLEKEAGNVFIDVFFGEKLWERLQRFMLGIELWNFRFDANCEEIMSDYPK